MIRPDRQRIKLHAKNRVLDESYGLIPLTFLYLLLTDWLSTLFSFTLPNPLTQVASVFMERFSSVADAYQAALLAGGNPETPSLSPVYVAATTTARELLSHPSQQIFLFVFLLMFLYGIVIDFGFLSCTLTAARDKKPFWTDLFDVLDLAGKIILVRFVTWILTYVGLFFFVLPGIVANYGLSLAPYILLDEPELNAFQAMKRSMELTRGHKLDLIALDLSFVGWMFALMIMSDFGSSIGRLTGMSAVSAILSMILYTVGACFVLPYRSTTTALYYDFFRQNQPMAED